jgi:biopolymer transport protein ExbD
MNLTGPSERRVVKKAELSLTPMIDVVFLLLIFFMVGMKFKELDRKLEADLPKAGKPLDDDNQPPPSEIWILIKNGGTASAPRHRIVIDQRPFTQWEDIRNTLARLARAPGAKQDPVIVAPDDDAQHGWVMTVLDYLHQLGFRNINFKQ